MMERAIGLIELRSIAKGLETADAMVKAARVSLFFSKPICPGKYLVLVGGGVASVESSVQAGANIAGPTALSHCVIPSVHESVFPALSRASPVNEPGALGIIETFSAVSTILAADAAAKAAAVELVEVRLATGIGGKAFVTLTGDVAAVEAAVQAGSVPAKERGDLVETVVIPAPARELFDLAVFGRI